MKLDNPLTTVVLTLYKRPALLEAQLQQISQQTFRDRFQLVIINNGDLTIPDGYQIDNVLDTGVNLGMAARLDFVYQTPSVIFLDDDIKFLTADAIEDLYYEHLYHDDAAVGWYAWRLIKGEGYWTRHRQPPGMTCDYLGNSFAIYPTDFIHGLTLPEDPMSINGFDDLWLSFQAYRAGLNKYSCSQQVEFIDDGLDTSPSIAEKKIEILDSYRAQGWDV